MSSFSELDYMLEESNLPTPTPPRLISPLPPSLVSSPRPDPSSAESDASPPSEPCSTEPTRPAFPCLSTSCHRPVARIERNPTCTGGVLNPMSRCCTNETCWNGISVIPSLPARTTLKDGLCLGCGARNRLAHPPAKWLPLVRFPKGEALSSKGLQAS
ncbi:hypothetical protein NPIL_384201 [Nephila pilipes]|uniref:Uncharacterized protein n=1 Tax=Nephila pilipes TaxID=299642 RepID=A0A8X6KK53_NEPPI|nr:hypothetical protein NPIL_384201 [Nephila pilipes]